ncbi:hypothetical protein BDV93DRAFT_606831 [Ceratobasidium sp. AG-I]|nr:hypothetical protein BDV93DRAFT_606831 [Ceratobasidium sp. AG-I]
MGDSPNPQSTLLLQLVHTVPDMAACEPRIRISIHHFPPELLAEVFCLATLVDNLAPMDIARVSTSWCTLVISMPRLWAVIELNELSFASIYLQRSDSVSLDLRANCNARGGLHLREAMDLMRPHWHRMKWITFMLSYRRSESEMLTRTIFKELDSFSQNSSTGVSGSQLRRLSFKSQGGYLTSVCEALPFANSLQMLKFIGIAPPTVPPERLVDMRELQLKSLSGHDLWIISAMPRLVSLIIENIIESGREKPLDHQISMVYLETLQLKHMSTTLGSKMIETILAPNLRRLALSTRWPYTVGEPVLWMLAASKYYNLVHLSISDGAGANVGPVWIQWLKDLKELQ